MSNFRQLIVWQKAIEFVAEIYRITAKFPESEKFSLVDQMRRAAISIPSNISEGCERKSAKDFANFLVVARGSAAELETQIIIALTLKYCTKDIAEKLLISVIELKKMLFVLRQKILITKSANCQLPTANYAK